VTSTMQDDQSWLGVEWGEVDVGRENNEIGQNFLLQVSLRLGGVGYLNPELRIQHTSTNLLTHIIQFSKAFQIPNRKPATPESKSDLEVRLKLRYLPAPLLSPLMTHTHRRPSDCAGMDGVLVYSWGSYGCVICDVVRL